MVAPGSLLWLMRHELRLWWRDLLSQPGGRTLAILVSSGLFLGMGLWLLVELLGAGAEVQELPDEALWIAVVAWLVVFQVSFAQGISLCLVRIFERGDLDLLVSSPLPERVIFASRLLMVILRQILGFWWVWILLGMLTILLPQTLAALPTLVMLLISSTSLAMIATLKLVQWMGAKQARAVAQIVSVGLSVILLGVARLSDQGIATVWSGWSQVFGPQAPLGVNSWIWFPARAALGDLPSLGLSLVIGIGLAWGSVEILHRSFIQGTQQVTTAHRTRSPSPQIRFRTCLPLLVIRKEWLLILRNPYLLSQIGLQLFSLVFLLFVLPESNLLEWLEGAQILAAATCVVSSLLVSALAAICISGEEAPDLLRSAPVERAQIQRLKLLAVLLPVWGLLLPVLIIPAAQGIDVSLAMGVNLGATLSAALLGLWSSRPRPLGDLAWRQRSPDADPILLILAFLCPYTWSISALLAGLGVWGLIGPMGMGIALVGLGYLRSHQLGTTYGF